MNAVNLVCLGDSITWGFPYGPQYSWVELSKQALGLNLINRGVNGDTANDLLYRFNEDVLQLNATHVLIMVGTNDASISVPLAEYSNYLKKMCFEAKSKSIKAIIGLPIPSLDKWLEYTLEKYRYWLKSFAADQNLRLIDFSSEMTINNSDLNPDCYSDEVHPSKAGYQAMSRQFVKWAELNFNC